MYCGKALQTYSTLSTLRLCNLWLQALKTTVAHFTVNKKEVARWYKRLVYGVFTQLSGEAAPPTRCSSNYITHVWVVVYAIHRWTTIILESQVVKFWYLYKCWLIDNFRGFWRLIVWDCYIIKWSARSYELFTRCTSESTTVLWIPRKC